MGGGDASDADDEEEPEGPRGCCITVKNLQIFNVKKNLSRYNGTGRPAPPRKVFANGNEGDSSQRT